MKNLNFKIHHFFFTLLILTAWLIYMSSTHQWSLFIENLFMSITMIFGSFIAGATSEGGGAVAFPVMTLIFQITPDVARNFSLAIQSIGMSAAAYLIFTQRIPINKTYLLLCSLGGLLGLILGTYLIAPIVSPPYTKMFFVSLWLSFGFILFYLNIHEPHQKIKSLPPLSITNKNTFILLGFLGGIIVSVVGSGLDILTFAFVTLRYRLSEKIATPTSVCLMAGNSLVGFLLHAFVIGDFGLQEFHYWLVCIPVVIFGAPLGAYFINQKSQNFIANCLYFVLIAQFIGALIVIQPSGLLFWFTLGTFVTGLIVFFSLAKWDDKHLKTINPTFRN